MSSSTARDLLGTKVPLDIIRVVREFMDYPKEAYDRNLLQAVGKYFRSVDPDVWLRALERGIAAARGPVVISDVRFPAEFAYFDKQAVSVYVYATQEVREARLSARDGGFNPERLKHDSEIFVEELGRKCRWVLDNNGTPQQLYACVQTLSEEMAA